METFNITASKNKGREVWKITGCRSSSNRCASCTMAEQNSVGICVLGIGRNPLREKVARLSESFITTGPKRKRVNHLLLAVPEMHSFASFDVARTVLPLAGRCLSDGVNIAGDFVPLPELRLGLSQRRATYK